MSVLTAGYVALTAAGIAFVVAWCYPAAFRAPVAANYRGREIPVVLGYALAAGVAGAVLPFSAAVASVATRSTGILAAWFVLSVSLVFVGGLYDDYRPSTARGLRAHARALARGRVTSGAVKLVALIVAGAVWALATHAGGWRLALGIPVMVGTANLFNLLDVAPGRAVKWGLLTCACVLFVAPSAPLVALIGASLVVAPLDLGERAMLGDSGSNVLGFVLGVALYDLLPVAGLAAWLGALVLLHAVAETVTLSKVIEAVPPLRWFDRAGLPRHGPEGRPDPASWREPVRRPEPPRTPDHGTSP